MVIATAHTLTISFKKFIFSLLIRLYQILFLNIALFILFFFLSGFIYKSIILIASLFSLFILFKYLIFFFRFKIEFQDKFLLYCNGFKTLKIAYQDIQYLQIVFFENTEYLLLFTKSQVDVKEVVLHIGSYLDDYLDLKSLFTAHYPVVSEDDLKDPNFDIKKLSINFKVLEFK